MFRFAAIDLHYTWSATNAAGSKYSDGVYQGRIADLDSSEHDQVLSVPHFDWDGGVATVDHYYANGVKYKWVDSSGGQTIQHTAKVEARTEMKLFTGGKAKVKRKGLIHLTGGAREWRQAASPFWEDTPSTNVPPPKIRILAGRVFGWKNLSGLGELYQALPEGEVLDLNMSVPFLKHYYAWASVVKHKLVHETVNPALTDTNLARTKLGVGEEVGFSFDPILPTNGTWSVTVGGLAMTSGPTNVFTAPSNAANTRVTVTVLGQSVKENFKVVEPTGVDHTVLENTYTNYADGQTGVGMKLRPYIGPTDVSFYRLLCMEVGMNATNVWGWYTNVPAVDLSHINNGADVPFCINPDNSWSNAWDYAYDVGPGTAPGYGGGYKWAIPGRWGFSNPPTNSLVGWDQVVSMDAAGTMTIEKLDWRVIRTTNSIVTSTNLASH